MLFLLCVLTIFLSAVVRVSASPVEVTPELMIISSEWSQPRHQLGRVYVCTGTNYTGHCEHLVHPLDSCNVLHSRFKRNIGSFEPDPCTLCFAYETPHCRFGNGVFWMFQSPGNATGGIGVPNNAWNTRIASFKCWSSPDCLAHI